MNTSHEEIVIDMIREDIRQIKEDVRELLSLRWKITGAVAILSILLSLGTNIVTQYLSK